MAELANVNFGYNSLVDLAGGVASQLSFIGTSNIDLDGKDITINGVYRIHAGGLVHPNSVSGDMLLHLGWDSNTAHQTLYSASPNIGTLVRHKSGGVWSDWGDK